MGRAFQSTCPAIEFQLRSEPNQGKNEWTDRTCMEIPPRRDLEILEPEDLVSRESLWRASAADPRRGGLEPGRPAPIR